MKITVTYIDDDNIETRQQFLDYIESIVTNYNPQAIHVCSKEPEKYQNFPIPEAARSCRISFFAINSKPKTLLAEIIETMNQQKNQRIKSRKPVIEIENDNGVIDEILKSVKNKPYQYKNFIFSYLTEKVNLSAIRILWWVLGFELVVSTIYAYTQIWIHWLH